MQRFNLYFIFASRNEEFSQDYSRSWFCDLEAFALNHRHHRLAESLAVLSGSKVNLSSSPLNVRFYIFKHLHESFQMNIFYNLESKAFSQNLQREEAFSLDVDVTEERDHSRMLLSICTK